MTGGRSGEFDLIKRFFAPLATDQGAAGLVDDAALLAPRPGYDLVLTKDMLAAGVHFFPDDPPEAIAAKALRVNLSDLAAKGAVPRGYLLGLGLPAEWSEDWLAAFCEGLKQDQSTYSVPLLGGDTIRSAGALTISITALGEVPAGRAVRRLGAKPGDLVYVTGTIGDAALGLRLRLGKLSSDDLPAHFSNYLLDRYLRPQPRVAFAEHVLGAASAAMDVSDGLSADLAHLCHASGVGAEIDVDQVPLSDAARYLAERDQANLMRCLGGGDDYEVLLSASPAAGEALCRIASQIGLRLTCIGRLTERSGEILFRRNGAVLSLPGSGGYQHF